MIVDVCYESGPYTHMFGFSVWTPCKCSSAHLSCSPVAPNTTADGPTMVTVNETDSVNISCTSTGLPTPGIQWTVGGVAARFEQVDTTVEAVGSTPGCVTSVLKIISAVPNDIGTYTCTGSSSVDGVLVGNSSDSIVVMVHVANPSKYSTESCSCILILVSTIQSHQWRQHCSQTLLF